MSTPLLKKVWSLRSLERAWRVINENSHHSKSEEVKKEVEQFRDAAPQKLRSLSSKLSSGSFKFPAARGVPIPKTDNLGKVDKTKFRPIVLAGVEARIVQRSILEVLLSLPDLKKYVHTPYSFGGIRKKTETDLAAVPGAIRAVLTCIQSGANFVTCADISKFFTRIPKSVVISIVSEAIQDEKFMDLFRKAIAVELSNMAELREKADAFPIYDIGVAQGNSLSPLLGNILLYEFDRVMNEGDCGCIRYIDDIIILAPTKKATQARLKKAERLLSKYDMSFGAEKSSGQAILVTESFEFLGIELCNGLIRPAAKAQTKLLANVSGALEESRKIFRSYKYGATIKKSTSLLSTLRRVDGIVQGWGKHYRFCNDGDILRALDRKISELIRSYIGEYSQARERAEEADRRALLGIDLLAGIERKPFAWPKRADIRHLQPAELDTSNYRD